MNLKWRKFAKFSVISDGKKNDYIIRKFEDGFEFVCNCTDLYVKRQKTAKGIAQLLEDDI